MKIKIEFPLEDIVDVLNENEDLSLTVKSVKANKNLLKYLKQVYAQDVIDVIREQSDGDMVEDGWNNDVYTNVQDYL